MEKVKDGEPSGEDQQESRDEQQQESRPKGEILDDVGPAAPIPARNPRRVSKQPAPQLDVPDEMEEANLYILQPRTYTPVPPAPIPSPRLFDDSGRNVESRMSEAVIPQPGIPQPVEEVKMGSIERYAKRDRPHVRIAATSHSEGRILCARRASRLSGRTTCHDCRIS